MLHILRMSGTPVRIKACLLKRAAYHCDPSRPLQKALEPTRLQATTFR